MDDFFTGKIDFDKYEDVKKGMVKNIKKLIKKYGKDAEKVIHGRAINLAKSSKNKQEKKIKEMIYSTLSHPEDGNKRISLNNDDEAGMLKANLYRIGKYAMELYQMMDELDGVDFPHWWQAKIIKSQDMMVQAKHYLDFEVKEPQIDAMFSKEPEINIVQNDNVSHINTGELAERILKRIKK